jgi:threonine dehydratase
MSLSSDFGIDLFREAQERISPFIITTPLVFTPSLSNNRKHGVFLKLENLQNTGSFKIRGASNKLTSLTEGERAKGVIAVSTGNHGRAVAYAASQLGVEATIILSEGVVEVKKQAIKNLGARIIEFGDSYDEATLHAGTLQRDLGLTFIHPFDDQMVIAGQATIGMEILDQLPEVETVLVPMSGGGLISGVAMAMKHKKPTLQIIGVSMERAPVLAESLRLGRIVDLEEEPTLADALVGGLGDLNRFTFDLCREYVDEVVLVSEAEIECAICHLFQEQHIVVEGGGAVGVAAVLAGKTSHSDGMLAIVCSGGNIDSTQLCMILGVDVGV